MEPDKFSKDNDDSDLYVSRIRISSDRDIIKHRKSIVEHPLVKRSMGAGHCLMKGKRNGTGEFPLTFLAYNLKRAIHVLEAPNLIAAFQV